MKGTTYAIAVFSDTHVGGTTALLPRPVHVDDGLIVEPSKAQRWIAQQWKTMWGEISEDLAELREESDDFKYYAISNGDLFDGDHHETSQIISRNPNAWWDVLDQILSPVFRTDPDKFFIVRGTSSHVGEAGRMEEAAARKYEAEPNPETRTRSWYHLRMELNGNLLDFAHHGRMGQRPWTEDSYLALYLNHIYFNHIREGRRPPDLVVRSHYHKMLDTGKKVTERSTPSRLITTGAWQLKTSYVHKIAPDSISDFGGYLIIVRPDGDIDVKSYQYKAKEDPVWQAE